MPSFIHNLSNDNRSKPYRLIDNQPVLKKTLQDALKGQWEHDISFERVLSIKERIAEGELPGGRLICLDLEFSPSSGKVFELGICEYHFGKVLLDTRVNHNGSQNALHPASDGTKSVHPFLELLSRGIYAKVYRTKQATSNLILDVHEIASQLQADSVTPNTLVMTWHQNKTDLVLLRRFLENAGYDNRLPPDENCNPMIPQFRKNVPRLPGSKRVPLNLEVVFPLIFPGHELVGRNHQAMADALQLRLVTMAFEKNCCLPEDREGRLTYIRQQRV